MRIRHLAVLAAAVFTSGCIELDLKLVVKKSGAGRLVERVVFDTGVLEDLFKMMESIAKKGDVPTTPERPWDFDEADLKKRATDRGKGVTLVAAKPIDEPKRKGWTATYAFANVDQLTLDPDPSERVRGGEKKAKRPMKFTLKKGSPAVLEIDVPQQGKKKEKPKGPPPPEQIGRITKMLASLRVHVSVEVEGKISKTNATHHQGSRITLMEIDFSKIAGDTKNVEKLAGAQSIDDLVGLPGVRIEQKEKVKITFD